MTMAEFNTSRREEMDREMTSLNRLKLHEAQRRDLKNDTSFVRLIEMNLDSINLGIKIQFFKDWQTYGLAEAITYLRGYEEQGEVPRGTSNNARQVAVKIYNNFGNRT